MGKVIAATCQKGGVGKSTLLRNLGIMCAAAGKKVCLVDSDDNQHSIDKWYTRREDFKITNQADYNGLFNIVIESSAYLNGVIDQALDTGYDAVLVDLPGRLDSPLAQMILRADFSLCPLSGSPDDYSVIPHMRGVVERAAQYKEDALLYIIYNKASTNANRRKAEIEDLKYQCSKSDKLFFSPYYFTDVVAFDDAAKYGLALFEYAELKNSYINYTNQNLVNFNNLYEHIFKESWVKKGVDDGKKINATA